MIQPKILINDNLPTYIYENMSCNVAAVKVLTG